MATPSEVVRHADLLNQLVLDSNSLEELGRIECVWMYPQVHRVLGFICKSGFLGGQKLALKLTQVAALGENGVLTRSQPEPTDAASVKQLETLIGCEVWTNAGRKVGKIIDCLFDLKTGTITDYLLVLERWRGMTGDIYQLKPTQILGFGHHRVLVADTTVKTLAIYHAGLQQTLSRMVNTAKAEYSGVTQELKSLTQRSQTIPQNLRKHVDALAQQSNRTVQGLTQQLKQETQSLAHQVRETGERLLEQLQDQIPSQSAHPSVVENLDESVWEDWEDWEDEEAEATVEVADRRQQPIADDKTVEFADSLDESIQGDWEDWEEEEAEGSQSLKASIGPSTADLEDKVRPMDAATADDDDDPWI
jgi:uncharacterized protein YrrD